IIASKFLEAGPFSEGIAPVAMPKSSRNLSHKKYGYINKEGEFIVKPACEQAFAFQEGRARVVQNGKFGFIKRRGQLIADPIYARAWDYHNGLAMVRIGRKYGYINKAGIFVLEPLS